MDGSAAVMGCDAELVAIVDEQNREAGLACRREMRTRNLIHRAAYILVFNRLGELFLQKRTATKDLYPSHYDIAAGGVVLAGESYDEAARRELAEELGLAGGELTARFDHYYADQANRVWGRIYSCVADGPFRLQAEEVASGMFLPVPEVLALSEREPFTPDGLEVLRIFLDLTP